MPSTVFTAEIPYALIWGEAGWLPLRIDGQDYEIQFERSWRGGSKNVEIKHDRLGRVSYTRIAVRFPYSTTGDDIDELTSTAHKAINRLLDVYRVATKEFHVGHIPIHELGLSDTAHGIFGIEDDGSITEQHSARFDMGLGLTMSRKAMMSSDALRDLAYERPLPVVDVLFLNAKRSVLFEDYRVAVIEAETAFEVGVDRILTRYYLSRVSRTTEGHIQPAYSRDSVKDLLDAGLSNLLRVHLPKALGREFIGTEEHTRWEKELYTLRNAVVHDGIEAGEDEARSALEAAEGALVSIGAMSL
ncbi:MAG: hypothetical protein OXE02_08245 [Chloroflexi bacterium]|nr:hypothetical protein [Chloroflexota bacterium]